MKKFFLATTSIEEYWDFGADEIIFANNSCCRFTRKKKWQTLNHVIMPEVCQSKQEFINIHQYLESVYQIVMEECTNYLNEYNSSNYDSNTWYILIGNWLKMYINEMYHSYLVVENVINKYEEIYSYKVKKTRFYDIVNLNNYLKKISEDEYYIAYIYSHILEYFKVKCVECQTKPTKESLYLPKEKVEKQVVKKQVMIPAKVLIKTCYLPNIYWKLRIFTLGKVQLSYANEDNLYDTCKFEKNIKKREEIFKNKGYEDDFINMIFTYIGVDFPLLYLEGFKNLDTYSTKLYGSSARLIISSTAWYTDDFFNWFAAKQKKRLGAKLMEIQHGGNYGVIKYVAEWEQNMIDKFYTWGWTDNELSMETCAMPAVKLLNRVPYGKEGKTDILFVTTGNQKSWMRFTMYSSNFFANYIEDELNFLKNLTTEIIQKVTMRIYPNEYGWDTSEQIKQAFPKLKIVDWSICFEKQLNNCSLFVVDHLATTWLESIGRNKPTIIFSRMSINLYTEEGLRWINKLKEIGVYHDSPESAAKTINQIYNNINEWWNEEKRQKILKEFSRNYVWNTTNAKKIWKEELWKLYKGIHK